MLCGEIRVDGPAFSATAFLTMSMPTQTSARASPPRGRTSSRRTSADLVKHASLS